MDERSSGAERPPVSAAYVRMAGEARFCYSNADRDEMVSVLVDRDPGAVAERVAEATAASAGLIARNGKRRGPGAKEPGLSGRDVFALGEAYWYTGDERFVSAFGQSLGGPSRNGRPNTGGPACGVWERTARLFGWLFAANCLAGSPRFTDEMAADYADALALEGSRLERALHGGRLSAVEKGAVHAGLAALGIVYPEIAADRPWRDLGLGWLAREAAHLLVSSGQSKLAFRTLVAGVECYLPVLALSMRNDLEVPGSVLGAAEDALDSLAPVPCRCRRRRLGRAVRNGSAVEETGDLPLLPMFTVSPGRTAALAGVLAQTLGCECGGEIPAEAEIARLFLLGPVTGTKEPLPQPLSGARLPRTSAPLHLPPP